jgi:glycosyltransferase involved in cell wall biosynthesis
VIAGNVSSLPEVAGDAALFVDPRDVDELARGIEKLLSDKTLREHLSKKGIRRAQEFSWERCAAETLRVYRRAYTG